MNMLREITSLINDTLSNKVALYSAEGAKFSDQAIREAIFEVIGDDKLTWQNFRNHKNELFTIIENVLTINLPSAWDNSPFYRQLVEIKNGALGDKNEFVVADNSILVASRFSGNHWDTDRQKLQGKKAFPVTTEWIYIHVYEDLEKFLKGTSTISDMIASLQKGFNAEIDSRIYASFNGVGTYLPAAFQETGTYDRKTMVTLIDRVQTAAQKNVVLAGTRSALSNIVDGVNASLLSEKQKDEIASTGALLNLTGLPASAILIPQSFIRGTYDFKVDNNTIFVLPDGTKPVKLFFEGNTRARDLNEKDTLDQTIDTQVQTKVGVGFVVDNVIGKYTVR